jgi:hypothetical protein
MSSSGRMEDGKSDTGTVTSPGKVKIAEPVEVALELLANVTVSGVCLIFCKLLRLLFSCNNI